eukprot:TRINITY_DN1237_c0_g1_i5.p1 TRINITY_DN1237_c0_g1~~TRINITY_DN1237_c0_g1_i5.p1  ORF type:complete len:303 (-),score=32.96 TRINITY_DN1237_c0_g1_i5:60-968(-)
MQALHRDSGDLVSVVIHAPCKHHPQHFQTKFCLTHLEDICIGCESTTHTECQSLSSSDNFVSSFHPVATVVEKRIEKYVELGKGMHTLVGKLDKLRTGYAKGDQNTYSDMLNYMKAYSQRLTVLLIQSGQELQQHQKAKVLKVSELTFSKYQKVLGDVYNAFVIHLKQVVQRIDDLEKKVNEFNSLSNDAEKESKRPELSSEINNFLRNELKEGFKFGKWLPEELNFGHVGKVIVLQHCIMLQAVRSIEAQFQIDGLIQSSGNERPTSPVGSLNIEVLHQSRDNMSASTPNRPGPKLSLIHI